MARDELFSTYETFISEWHSYSPPSDILRESKLRLSVCAIPSITVISDTLALVALGPLHERVVGKSLVTVHVRVIL